MKRIDNPFMFVILREMCRRAGVNYFDIDFFDSDWYMKHSWSTKAMNSFIDWLADYLYRVSPARKSLLSFPYPDKKRAREWAEGFVWNHGWKQNDK